MNIIEVEEVSPNKVWDVYIKGNYIGSVEYKNFLYISTNTKNIIICDSGRIDKAINSLIKSRSVI